jgi:hypothetical protein
MGAPFCFLMTDTAFFWYESTNDETDFQVTNSGKFHSSLLSTIDNGLPNC